MKAFLSLLLLLNQLNVNVTARPLPFPFAAIYRIDHNLVVLNDDIEDLGILKEGLVHEAVHVAQDCAAGLENDEVELLGIEIPDEVKEDVDRRYVVAPEWQLPFEYEAEVLEENPEAVMDFLKYHCFDEE